MKMTTIHLIVGGKVLETSARIVNRIAEVKTEVGIREFGSYYLAREDAEERLATRKRTKEQNEDW